VLLDIITKLIEVVFQLSADTSGVDFARSAILGFVNILEVILIYAVIYFLLDTFQTSSFDYCCEGVDKGAISVEEALIFSRTTMFTMDSEIKPCTWQANLGVGTQLFVALFLVAVILVPHQSGIGG